MIITTLTAVLRTPDYVGKPPMAGTRGKSMYFNPYATDETTRDERRSDQERPVRPGYNWRIFSFWLLVGIANLPLPLLRLSNSSKLLQITATGTFMLVFMSGACLIRCRPVLMFRVCVGLVLQAITQLWPALQALALGTAFLMAMMLTAGMNESPIKDDVLQSMAIVFYMVEVLASAILIGTMICGMFNLDPTAD